jgi:hypothetical protein
MKKYEVEIQEENNFCLCSVLQAILRKHEVYFSQREIANNLTPSEKGFYADDERIKIFLNNNNFQYEFYWHNQTPFNERDSFLIEMNNHEGILGINNHVYLLNEFKDPILTITNPKDAKQMNTDIYFITKEMHEKGGFFGLLKYIF